MTGEPEQNDSHSQDEWEIYLQVFLDEGDEALEALVQALLRLEDDPRDAELLNDAFRLLHTHKGSAGLMGFEGIGELAHELENRFDQLRSGKATLDRARITVMLQCVDFLRAFNAGLRAGEKPDQDASHIVRQLEELEQVAVSADADADTSGTARNVSLPSIQGGYQVRIMFEDGLQLVDMKARLIVARLSNIGEIIATDPPVDDMLSVDDLSQFVLVVLTDRDPDEVSQIANVDGVKSVEIVGGESPASVAPDAVEADAVEADAVEADAVDADAVDADVGDPDAVEADAVDADVGDHVKEPLRRELEPTGSVDKPEEGVTSPASQPAKEIPSPNSNTTESPSDHASIAETVRVDIERLDKLMNLTGELIVTKARLGQVTDEMNSIFRTSGSSHRANDVSARFRLGLNKLAEVLAAQSGEKDSWQKLLHDLRADLDVVEETFAAWEEGRRYFGRMAEAVDQLNRVSGNLQQSVLDTRMVPVAPLFNRFRRVIRDLAGERNKQVQLVIRGERTELDKRMIDELGDPLLHLVRNALDHGLELPAERRQLGKSNPGTIVMEASHRGNNVFITVSDDGAGLNIGRIRQRVLEVGLATAAALADMSESQIINYIWHPGFSTTERITDISGRGVGMDVVKTRIAELNGSIEIETTADQGTRFRLRLPLTLAIIRCLLVRFRAGFFSMPIEDVREIVAVERDRIHSIHGSETIDVRGEFVPLIRMDRVFYWHDIDYHGASSGPTCDDHESRDIVNVVMLRSAGRTIGLCVDELLGSADIVIKSLSDNFVNIQGLSGASIRGDGTVCLMLDTSEVIKMATERRRS